MLSDYWPTRVSQCCYSCVREVRYFVERGQAPSSLLNPRPGSYIPFSDGHRGCLGKRFALVELVAVVSRIFKEYRVELAFDCPADASEEYRRKKWEEAREKAEREMSLGVKFKLSLRMTGHVPIRFAKREKDKAL